MQQYLPEDFPNPDNYEEEQFSQLATIRAMMPTEAEDVCASARELNIGPFTAIAAPDIPAPLKKFLLLMILF